MSDNKHIDYNVFKDRDRENIEANDFACAILMPEKVFRDYINKGNRNYETIAEHFDVSLATVRYWVLRLGIIKDK